MIVFERLREEGKLTLTYQVKEMEYVDSVVLGMLKNNDIEGLVPVKYLQVDESKKFIFTLTCDKDVSNHLSSNAGGWGVLSIFKEYVRMVDKIKKYLIPPVTIVRNDEYMYINQDGKIEFVCVPLESQSNMTDKECMLSLLEYWMGKYGSKYQGICQEIRKWIVEEHLTPRELIYKIEQKEIEWKKGTPVKSDGPIVLGRENNGPVVLSKDDGPVVLGRNNSTPVEKGRAYLFHKNANKVVEISKTYFGIGKLPREMDYVIKDNIAISKKHAAIVYKNDIFYIVDTYSTNHVYLNGRILEPGKEVVIKNNDVIRLANEEFVFEEKALQNMQCG